MTILNETTELIQEGYTWGVDLGSVRFWFLFFISSMITVLFIWLLIDNWHEKIYLKIFCIVIILFGIFTWTVAAFHSKPVYKEVKQYEVTINPFIPFRMIYDNYDIIEQRGDIFILRDKNG